MVIWVDVVVPEIGCKGAEKADDLVPQKGGFAKAMERLLRNGKQRISEETRGERTER